MASLIHHSAGGGHNHPPGSLAALKACLEEGARLVEIDVTALADGDFALLHDAHLEGGTDGQGVVAEATAAQVKRLYYVIDGRHGDESVGLLTEAIALAREYSSLVELQLDLKEHGGLPEASLASLLRLVEPLKARVRVSSCADWSLRWLRARDPGLALGFDPQFYLDVETGEEGQRMPRCRGPFGYRDDHPLAGHRWAAPAAYLAARAEALLAQAPSACVWYIRATCLTRALDDGFDWVAYLHRHQCLVAAWTLNPEPLGETALAARLIEAGADRITTDAPSRLATALGGRASF